MPIFRRAPDDAPTAPPNQVPPYDPAATQPLPAPAAYETVVEEYPPPPPPAPRIWPWLVALLVLLALGIGIGLGYALTRDDNQASSTTTTTAPAAAAGVTVPDVVGQRADRAASQLVDAGLKTTFRRQLSQKPSSTVLSQEPPAAAKTSAGSTVVLTIARGGDTSGVPAVVGLTLAQAIAKLRAAGLQASEKRVAGQKPAGQVIAQTPGGGRELQKGATVALTISRGAQPVAVPDVVGQTQADATSALKAAGLEARVLNVPSSKPKGTVVVQSPRAGERKAKRSKVQINVSQGRAGQTTTPTTTTGETPRSPVPANVQIPDVVGMSLADARASLANAGLRADPKPVPSTEPKNTVVAQYPAAGAPAKHGGSVRVNVSQGPTAKAVPDVVGADETTATTKLENAGFTVKVVRQDTTDPSEDGVVLDETPAGGDTAKPGAKVTLTIGSLASG